MIGDSHFDDNLRRDRVKNFIVHKERLNRTISGSGVQNSWGFDREHPFLRLGWTIALLSSGPEGDTLCRRKKQDIERNRCASAIVGNKATKKYQE